MELIKDLAEAISTRIRSPIFGSVLFSFLAFNWKPIGFVLYHDGPLKERFAYWDENLLLIAPIATGLLLALFLPWVKYIGSWLAYWPTEEVKVLQASSARAVRIKELEDQAREDQAIAKAKIAEIRATSESEDTIAALQERREKRKIEDAKRLKEARDVSDELSKDIEQSRKEDQRIAEQEKTDQPWSPSRMTDVEKFLLRTIAMNESGKFQLRDNGSSYSLLVGKQSNNITNHRQYLVVQDAIAKFRNWGLVEEGSDKVTMAGYLALDEIGTENEDTSLEAIENQTS